MNYHVYENGVMDNILANDVRNQLQCDLGFADYSETGKLEVGVVTEKKGWDKIKNNVFYRTSVVTIGNDDFIVMALRSYDTVIGFIWNDRMYIIGKYSQTTSRHINDLKAKLFQYCREGVIYYNRREV